MELIIIESTANYHMLNYETLREEGINNSVINPIVVKALLRVEGKSDKVDAMTLAKLNHLNIVSIIDFGIYNGNPRMLKNPVCSCVKPGQKYKPWTACLKKIFFASNFYSHV